MKGMWVLPYEGAPHTAPEPRKLTEGEIDHILSHVDNMPVKCVVNDYAKLLINHIKVDLYNQLKKLVIAVKGEETLDEIVVACSESYNRAKANLGLAVGHIASLSIISKQFQGSMDSFKLTKTATTSITELEALMYTQRKKNDALLTIIHFRTREPFTKEDVFDLRCDLLDLRLNKTILDWQIGTYTAGLIDSISTYWWHKVHEIRTNRKLPTGSRVLRLYLDSMELFVHQVTPETISRAISKMVEGQEIITLFSPFHTGLTKNDMKTCIVDVVAIPDQIANGRTPEGQTTFLMREIIGKMKDVKVKGIDGLNELIPKTYPLKSIIKTDFNDIRRLTLPLNQYEGTFVPQIVKEFVGTTKKYLNNPNYNFYIIDVDDIGSDFEEFLSENRFQKTGSVIVDGEETHVVIASMGGSRINELRFLNASILKKIPNNFKDYGRCVRREIEIKEEEQLWVLPNNLDNQMVGVSLFPAYDRLIDYLNRNGLRVVGKILHPFTKVISSFVVSSDENPALFFETAPLEEYCYAVAYGGSYEQILRLSYVDPYRTLSNSIHSIYEQLGCEASRRYFMYNLSMFMGGAHNSEVNPRHMSFISDLIYLKGNPLGTTLVSNIARGQGYVSASAEEKGGITTRSAALNIAVEPTSNVSVSIITGQKPYIGEGFSLVLGKNEKTKQLESKSRAEKERRSALLKSGQEAFRNAVRERNTRYIRVLSQKHTIDSNISLDGRLESNLETITPAQTSKPSPISGDLAAPIIVPKMMTAAAKTINTSLKYVPDSSLIVTKTTEKTPVDNSFPSPSFYEQILSPITKPYIKSDYILDILKEVRVEMDKNLHEDILFQVPSLPGKAPIPRKDEIITGEIVKPSPLPVFKKGGMIDLAELVLS